MRLKLYWAPAWRSTNTDLPLKCDSTSAIYLAKNPIMHSKTKHIEIRHHFLRDHISKGDWCIEFIDSEHQLADIFTKPLARDRFFFIRNELDILDGSSIEWGLSLVHATCYICSMCLLILFKCLSMLICWCVIDFSLGIHVLLCHFIFFHCFNRLLNCFNQSRVGLKTFS